MASMLNPAGEEEYTPPVVPVCVTVTLATVLQNGDPEYEILPVGNVVTVTMELAVCSGQPFELGIV